MKDVLGSTDQGNGAKDSYSPVDSIDLFYQINASVGMPGKLKLRRIDKVFFDKKVDLSLATTAIFRIN